MDDKMFLRGCLSRAFIRSSEIIVSSSVSGLLQRLKNQKEMIENKMNCKKRYIATNGVVIAYE